MTKYQNTHKFKNRLFGISLPGLALLAGLLTPLLLMVQPVAAAACATPSPSYGTDSIPISVPSTATYVIWTRLEASAASNEVLLQVDSSNCYTVGGSSSIPTNAWTWVDYQNGSTTSVIQLSLAAGAHTLKYLGNQTGISIDRVELIGGGACTPTGTGDNCVATTTTTSPATSSPGAGSSSSGTSTTTSTSAKASTTPGSSFHVTSAANSGTTANPLPLVQGDVVQDNSTPLTVAPVITNPASVTEVEYYLNSKLVYTAKKAPFSYKVNTANLLNGSYKLTSKTFYDSGKIVSQTETLIVKHPLLTELRLIFEKYLLKPIILLVILGAAFVFWRRRSHQPPATGPAADSDSLVNWPPTSSTLPAEPTNEFHAPAIEPPIEPESSSPLARYDKPKYP